jgi:hypothetical protein
VRRRATCGLRCRRGAGLQVDNPRAPTTIGRSCLGPPPRRLWGGGPHRPPSPRRRPTLPPPQQLVGGAHPFPSSSAPSGAPRRASTAAAHALSCPLGTGGAHCGRGACECEREATRMALPSTLLVPRNHTTPARMREPNGPYALATPHPSACLHACAGPFSPRSPQGARELSGPPARLVALAAAAPRAPVPLAARPVALHVTPSSVRRPHCRIPPPAVARRRTTPLGLALGPDPPPMGAPP